MELTELCLLADKYGTDKCLKLNHSYTPYYYQLFNPIRNEVRRVMELGIGRTKPSRGVKSGASLKMWRDFFPNAQIYGIDIVRWTQFSDKRIKTFLGDGTDKAFMEEVLKKTGDVDIFIDDGSHQKEDQMKTVKIMFPHAKIYIIEDVMYPYDLDLPDFEILTFNGRDSARKPDDCLYVHNKWEG